jgi:hypothetical protein
VQTLKVVPRLMPDIRSGLKLHTIRWRECKILPGAMQYVNMTNAADRLTVWVTKVESMPLSAVADYLNQVEEWPDAILLAGMREHYPEIQLDSVVDVIHHLPPAT